MTFSSTSPPLVLSTLDNSYGLYRTRPANFLVSLLVHALGISFAIWLAAWTASRTDVGPRIRQLMKNASPISFSSENPGGHGGGGTHDRLAASKGAVPKMTLDDQLAPPEAVPTNLDPKLPEPPSVMALSAVKLPQLGQLGDPLSAVQGPLSNGPGGGAGTGSGCCGGVGPSTGPGFGPYDHGNVFQPGRGGVTAPRPVYDPDPDYSEAARKARFQGDVVLGWSSVRMAVRATCACSARWAWVWTRRRSKRLANGASSQRLSTGSRSPWRSMWR
jgi:protein TonB